MGNVYGTYTGRIGTYNNSQEYREGCMERIGTYRFRTQCQRNTGRVAQNVQERIDSGYDFKDLMEGWGEREGTYRYRT